MRVLLTLVENLPVNNKKWYLFLFNLNYVFFSDDLIQEIQNDNKKTTEKKVFYVGLLVERSANNPLAPEMEKM